MKFFIILGTVNKISVYNCMSVVNVNGLYLKHEVIANSTFEETVTSRALEFASSSKKADVKQGIILGPLFYLVSPEWSILLAGGIGGTLAFLIKGKKHEN